MFCVKAPPITGLTMLETAKVDIIVPVYIALLCSGTIVVRMVRPPANMPDAPRPATARPTMSALEDGANAHTRFTISKIQRYNK